MSNNNQNTNNNGIGFIGLLQIVFITLKLLGKITWSWLWVLSPTLFSIILIILIISILYKR